MNLKKLGIVFSVVAAFGFAVGTAVAQDSAPTPTPTIAPTPIPRGCQDRDINRKIARVDLRQRLLDNYVDRVSIAEQNRDIRIEYYNEQIKDIRDGRSPVSAGFCRIISFIRKCDTTKAIARLENSRERVQNQYRIRIERALKLVKRAEERLALEKKILSDLYGRCGITPPPSDSL